MNFSEFFIKKPVFCIVLSLFIIIIGILSLLNLPLRQYPDTEKSIVTIDTVYPGAASTIVETKITELIESQISGIEGIKSISSVSRDGRSKITIEFLFDKDINEAANDVRDSVARVLEKLPKDSDPPEISKIDSDTNAIMWLNLTSDDLSQVELTDYAERYLIDRLSVITGVAKIRISGGKKKSVRVWIDPFLLSQYKITVREIEEVIKTENIEFPAGRIESQSRDFTVKLVNSYRTIDDFKNLVIKKGDGDSFVRLGDLADISFGAEESRQIFRGNGEEMIGLGVVKQTSANLIKVADLIRKEYVKIKKELPENIKIYESYDTSLFVSEALEDVIFTLCFAVLLVTIIILFFLKSLKSTLIPFITVPISILSTFIFLNLFGYSINLITLLALVLCTGLVIDDSIVMLENIHKKIESGESLINASLQGSKEVFFAIISTSIVLVSIFIPIVFLEGDTAKLLEELAVTIIGAIFFSTLISLTLTPMLCSRILEVNSVVKEPFFQKLYLNILEVFLKKKFIFFLILITIIGLILYFFKFISQELSPREDRGAFFLVIESPEGSTFQNTVNQMLQLEEKLLYLNQTNEAKRILLRVPRSFSGTENYSDGIGIIVLNHWDERRKIWEIMEEIRSKSNQISDAKIIIFPPRGLGQRRSGSQVQFVISGDTYENVDSNMNIIIEEISKNKNFLFVRTDYKKSRPQLKILIDKKKADDLGVSNLEIGRTLEILLAGRKINSFIDKGQEYYVILQAKKEFRKNIKDVLSYQVKNFNNELIRLENLVKVEESAEAKELNRYNKMRAITLSAGLEKGYSLGEALNYLEYLSKEKLIGNYKIDFKGQSKEFKESSDQFFFLFIISLIFVYLVLCAQFESFRYPLIIMLSVPLTLFAPIISLIVFENSLNIFSQIGIIILMGIAAKNGILIVEFARQLKLSGNDTLKSIHESCKKRFRPIIMTGVSTIVGVIPLVIGSGAGYESRLTIGIVLISGIFFSIFLTLFITPMFFKIFDKKS